MGRNLHYTGRHSKFFVVMPNHHVTHRTPHKPVGLCLIRRVTENYNCNRALPLYPSQLTSAIESICVSRWGGGGLNRELATNAFAMLPKHTNSSQFNGCHECTP